MGLAAEGEAEGAEQGGQWQGESEWNRAESILGQGEGELPHEKRVAAQQGATGRRTVLFTLLAPADHPAGLMLRTQETSATVAVSTSRTCTRPPAGGAAGAQRVTKQQAHRRNEAGSALGSDRFV